MVTQGDDIDFSEIELDEDEAESLLSAAVMEDEHVWLETFGKILVKAGQVEFLVCNYLQEQVVAAIKWCRDNGFPCRLVILKPRQKGSSTVTTGCLYHHLQRNQSNGLIIGGQFDHTDNLWKITQRYALLDGFEWPSGKARITQESGTFGNGSSLSKETAGDSEAARSGTFQFVIATEIGRWRDTQSKNAADILTGVLACVPDLPNTVVVLESTAQGPSGVFYNRWQDADDWVSAQKAGKKWKGQFIRIFAPWYAFDDSFDELSSEEAEMVRKTLTQTEKELMSNYSCTDYSGRKYTITLGHISWRRKIIKRDCDSDEVKFDREYPTTPQHAFRASAKSRLSRDGLDFQKRKIEEMEEPRVGYLEMNQSSTVASFIRTDEEDCIFHFYEFPSEGLSYILSLDVMTGQSQVGGSDPDAHCGIVLRRGYFDTSRGWLPPMVVARTKPECRWDVDVLSEHIWRLAMFYGRCLVVPEVEKDRGQVELIRAKGSVPIYQREIRNHVNGKMSKALGWSTNGSTRLQIEEELARAIRTYDEQGGGVIVRCPFLLKQLETWCVNAKSGRSEALPGSHDDDVMALGIGLCTVNQATRFVNRYTHVPLPRDLRKLESGMSGSVRRGEFSAIGRTQGRAGPSRGYARR